MGIRPIDVGGNAAVASRWQDPEIIKRAMLKTEAYLDVAFNSREGIARVASALTSPVRKYLDHVPFGRRVVVSEPIPTGQIAYFDADIEEFYATKVAEDGTTNMLICSAVRTIVQPFEMMVKPKVPFKEVKLRKYKVVERVKERLKQSLGLREDLLWLSLFSDASTAVNNQVVLTDSLSKDSLAMAFQEVEKWRLVTASVIISPAGVSAIRRWQRDYIDEVARIEIRRTGFLGNLWGANFYVTNLLSSTSGTTSYAYVLSSPQFLAWNPIWANAEVVPADRPDDGLLGFNGYQLMGMIVHNSKAVARVQFVSKL